MQRFEIVNGVTEVEGIAEEKTTSAEEDEEKGVPAFWLNAMKNNEVLTEKISERDEGALKFLKDIKWSRIDNPNGFKLEFYFDTNPYFTNTVLTKIYHMIDEDEPILEKDKGGGLAFLKGDLFERAVIDGKTSQTPLVYINEDREYVIFDPYDKEGHKLGIIRQDVALEEPELTRTRRRGIAVKEGLDSGPKEWELRLF
ncbi:nucleosome assembly protein 1;3-like [Arachis duranensis]|uniref:Nucleosome assembly protein 13-like n=1 Tax=Arachis duranensis TaxID=130453 RepID=A0A9C6T3F3_ARADU|nr:nucleosome assembly protein 1;3-like [Arachis duranensis]